MFSTIIVRAVLVAASVVLLSGRGGTELLSQPASSYQMLSKSDASMRSAVSSNTASTGDVIISSNFGIYVYSSMLKPLTQISVQNEFGQPAGLALDTAGNLYVANAGTNGIPVYKNDYKTLIMTLTDSNPSQGIAVAQNGVVGVIESYPPRVTMYASGSTTPCANLSLPNVYALYQGAFDSIGNFYITGQVGQNPNFEGFVGVIRGGCSATGVTLLSTANYLGQYIYGIAVTRFGKIAVGAQSNKAIYTYNPPINGALGKPIATTILPAKTGALYQFGFTAEGAFVFISEESAIAKYPFPAGGNPLQVFGQRQQLTNATGLVVAPPAQP